MDWLRGWLRRVRTLLRRDTAERELADELSFHVEMETTAQMQRGLTAAEARRAALHEFGSVDRFGEEARDARGFRWWDEIRQDVRVALRLARREPNFTIAAVLTLALGIGANTAIFTMVDSVLLRATPFADPDRLLMVWETDLASKTSHEPAAWPDIVDMRERSRTLADIGALIGVDGTITGSGTPERVSVLGVTPNLPALLGVAPLLGQSFDTTAVAGAQHALLAEEYWRRRYQADPAVIGSSIILNERPTEIIGVLPAAADLGIRQLHARADYSAPFIGTDVDIWLAVHPTPVSYPRSTHPFLTLARLSEFATRDAAQQELAAVMAELEQTYPENAARGVNLEPYTDVTFGAVRPALLVLLGGVLLVLLIACVNVANLLLARTTARMREVAVRRALGAGTPRIQRQFLVEGLVLAIFGAVFGVVLAYAGLRVLIALAPRDIPRLDGATLDLRVLAFTTTITVVVALIFGLAPVLEARRVDVQRMLKTQAGRRTTEARETRRFRNALVVAQVALAVTLAISATLVLRSFQLLTRVDPGFRVAGVLKAEYTLPRSGYAVDFSRWPEAPAIHGFHTQLLERVRALPGVSSAALAARHPLDPGFTNSFVIVGREAESADFPEIRTRVITPGYLQTGDVRLVAGRDLTDSDIATTAAVGMINVAAATRYFAGMEPIGQSLRFWGAPRRIVGVIADERFHGVDRDSEPAIYIPLAQAPQATATVLVRSERDVLALVPELERIVHALDPDIALHSAEPLERTLATSIARQRFTATLLGLFGGVALLLALVGVHGVLSYTVAQRAPEVGIRMALGATSRGVLGLVVREGAALTTIGIVIGALAAAASGRLLAGILFGVQPHDAVTYATVITTVLTLALFASWLPARRAARAHPMDALRTD